MLQEMVSIKKNFNFDKFVILIRMVLRRVLFDARAGISNSAKSPIVYDVSFTAT